MYVYHLAGQRIRVPTREAWLEALKSDLHHPKPPEWWLDSQEREENRPRRQAAIIWASRYDNGRKYLIWSQAPTDDFLRLGYLEG